MGLIDVLFNTAKTASITGNVSMIKPVPQERARQNLDTTAAIFAPKAFSQFEIETNGNQNSQLYNNDVVIRGNFDNLGFVSLTENEMIDGGWTNIINPVVDSKVSNAMLYQGYDVLDGDF